MNILTTPPPANVLIDGSPWPINTCFRAGVEFELLMQNGEIPANEKVSKALEIYYPKTPTNIAEAVGAAVWFYRCGNENEAAENDAHKQIKRSVKAYCFEQDAGFIFSAFWECYGIDLGTTPLHWWEFRALFASLPPTCRFREIMDYRTADLAGMPKKQKAHYEKMRKLYALKNQMGTQPALSLAERDLKMKEYVAQRFKEAGETNGQRSQD